MSQPSFHRRLPELGEGEGYGIRSREGWIIAAIGVVLCSLSVVVPVQLGLGAWEVYLIAAASIILVVGALLWVIVTHSD